MVLYTINDIQINILKLDENYKFFGSIPHGDDIFLLYSTIDPKIEKLYTIKVCWANNMNLIHSEDNLNIITIGNEREKTQIDEKYHLFEIIQLEEDMTEVEFKYIATKMEESCR